MKKKETKSPLRKAIEELLEKYEETDLIDEIIMQCERYANKDYNSRLKECMKDWLRCYGYNIIKTETLSEQIQIEEMLSKIYPYQFQKNQIQIAY